jgi:poly-gamma-glutamate capsule biosynthesis protein CapA/YwtB (metallophosphatase superfamily)
MSNTALSRRAALMLGLGAAGAAQAGALASAPLKVALLGQCVIKHDLCAQTWPGKDPLVRHLSGNDVVFSELESVVRGPLAGTSTREDPELLHAAGSEALHCLKALRFNLLALSGNHAFDLGTGGILSTIEAMRGAGVAFAGIGRSLDEAAAPGYLETPRGGVGLVAMASGKVREGGAATASRGGVNKVRVEAGVPNAEDVARYLGAIAQARAKAQTVIAYQHNHVWDADITQPPAWQRALARRCVEAGASVFVGHGAPVVQGVEVYRGAPLFFSLGSFIFQTDTPPGRYPAEAWEGVIVDCTFRDGRCVSARATPIVLNERGIGGPRDFATRGRPGPAAGEAVGRILERLARRSAALGATVTREGGSAEIRLG